MGDAQEMLLLSLISGAESLKNLSLSPQHFSKISYCEPFFFLWVHLSSGIDCISLGGKKILIQKAWNRELLNLKWQTDFFLCGNTDYLEVDKDFEAPPEFIGSVMIN